MAKSKFFHEQRKSFLRQRGVKKGIVYVYDGSNHGMDLAFLCGIGTGKAGCERGCEALLEGLECAAADGRPAHGSAERLLDPTIGKASVHLNSSSIGLNEHSTYLFNIVRCVMGDVVSGERVVV